MTQSEKQALQRFFSDKAKTAQRLFDQGNLDQAADTLEQLAPVLRTHHENNRIITNRLDA